MNPPHAGEPLLTPSIAACARLPTRFHTLAVDNTRAGLGGAACREAYPLPQGGMDPFQRAIYGPLIKVVADDGRRREVVGDEAPLAAGMSHVEQRVDDPAQIMGAGAAGGRSKGASNAHCGSVKSVG